VSIFTMFIPAFKDPLMNRRMKKSITSKSNRLSGSSNDSLFDEVKEWKSELNFYKIELAFLKSLLNKDLLGVVTPKELTTISALLESVSGKSKNTLPMLMKSVLAYESTLAKISEGFRTEKTGKIVKNHNETKLKVFVFVHEMRILKKKIFALAEKKITERKKISADYMEGSLAL